MTANENPSDRGLPLHLTDWLEDDEARAALREAWNVRSGPRRALDAWIEQVRGEQGEQARADAASLEWLRAQFHEVQHLLRMLADFRAWFQSPGRDVLFHRLCRNVTAEEWDTRAAPAAAVPWIFGDGSRMQEHLRHCAFCGFHLLYAQGRAQAKHAGLARSAAGIEWLEQLTLEICPDVLTAASVPVVPGPPIDPAPGSFGQWAPPVLICPPYQIRHRGETLESSAVLQGDASLGLVELTVTADLITPEHGVVWSQVVFPNPEHPSPVIDLGRESEREIRLVTPLSPGRRLFRYAVRPFQAPRQFPYCNVSPATMGGVLGGTFSRLGGHALAESQPQWKPVQDNQPAVTAAVGAAVLDL